MRKFCFLVAVMVLGFLNFQGFAQENSDVQNATVIIDGQFFTFNAQNPDDPRDEPFSFTSNTYDNESLEFDFNPDVTYDLKGQNQANTYYVYLNGVQVANTYGADQTGFCAQVKFAAGDKLEIYEATPYVGTVKIDGQFYTFNAQDPDNTRNEAFAFTYAEYDNESKDFNFSPGVTYEVKGQNQNNSFYVYVNGVLVPNENEEGMTGYTAHIKFTPGCEVEIYEETPYVASVKINGEFYTFVAQNPDNTKDEAFDFTYNTYDNETREFKFSPNVTYSLKGQNPANIFYVYRNGVQIMNTVDADASGYEATVKFAVGDEIEIYVATPYVATVKVNGHFYTLNAQDPDNTRNEAFAFTNGEYDNEVKEFSFSPALTYELKATDASGKYFVYQNGVQVANTYGADDSNYCANVKFAAGDVIEIYEATPYKANVTISGRFYTFVAQDVNDNRNEAFAFTNNTYNDETVEFNFSPEVTYTLKGQNEADIFYVYQNGVLVPNSIVSPATGYQANVKFAEGDKIEIYETTPYTGTVKVTGQFYTLVAQNPDNTREEPFDFTNDTYNCETREFKFSPSVSYVIKAQNESNSFYVYQNGVRINNTVAADATGYEASIEFKAGDVIEIYEETPYVASVKINGQFYTFVAQNPDNTKDEAFDFTYNTYDNETREFKFSPATTYTLKGQNPEDVFYVYQNGVRINNTVEAPATGYEANVKFAAGDEIEIYVSTPYVASVKVNGQFYTFVAQNTADNKDEAFDFTNNTYDNETREFTFSPGSTYTLKGQNEKNTFYVYQNGVKVPNSAEDPSTLYQADVKFAAGDIIEIYEATPYVGTVKINGQFYTFNAQDPDNTRNEAFSFTNSTYENESREFDFSPEVTYEIKGTNEAETYFVYVNGVRVPNLYGENEQGFFANVKFTPNCVVEIYEATPYVGTVKVDGRFYTLVAQNPDNTRDEPFDFKNGAYNDESREFTFSPDITYTIKAQNEENIFYVYQNGIQVPNSVVAPATGYEANVKFAANDVIEIYEETPYVATVTINGEFYTFNAQNPDNTREEPFAFTNGSYENETREFKFAPGVTYEIKGTDEDNIYFVYLNGVQVPNKYGEGEQGYCANIKFEAGDNLEIYQLTPYVATVKINGQFNTFVAQNPDNTRDEAFDFTNNTYDNESQEFYFSPGVTYALKGTNPDNNYYVYLNGVEVANEYGEDEQGYLANVKFQAGDVLEIYEVTPYKASVMISGDFYTFVAQNLDNTRDEAFDFTYGSYSNETEEFTFSPAVTYALKGQNEANVFFVFVNDELVANEYGEGEQGFYAEVKFQAGDVVKIYAADPSGISNITIDELENTTIYNLQGVRMNSKNLTPGIYIVNGKKHVVR